MSPAPTYATMTFAAGIILLLSWAYVTTDNPRSNKLLIKSLWLFVLPGIAIWAVPDAAFRFPLSMWVLVLVEEGLKTFAATTERSRADRFWLITLFGIWELMLAKPMWGLATLETLNGWNGLQMAGLVAAGAVTVLMHTVTAAIYSFHFEKRLPAAFFVSCIVHIVFNESVDLFGVSLPNCLIQALVLLVLLVALWPRAYRHGSTEETNS